MMIYQLIDQTEQKTDWPTAKTSNIKTFTGSESRQTNSISTWMHCNLDVLAVVWHLHVSYSAVQSAPQTVCSQCISENATRMQNQLCH